MPTDNSITWQTPLRRGPCPLSWWRSSGSCGRTVVFKPALTELQSSSLMTRHLSKTPGGRWDDVQEKPHPALSARQWKPQTHKLNLRLWGHLPVPCFAFLYTASLQPMKLKTQNSKQRLCLAALGPISRGKPKKDGQTLRDYQLCKAGSKKIRDTAISPQQYSIRSGHAL